ncbi:hypothetical protein SAMN05216201_106120 [Pseudomonas linyingensis]|uniref:O-antigen ligase like membrane protein n=1 Tax=Pseudomonas linyingensis TaxID=915471 RepID=A0A1H6XEL0_9PSED|nr:hypothetical protein [Pseudomonas linyingensis]SEJ25934.1 hypothetical protein SAMN05216201_106120 [Pseudomonas linyingensis]
MLTINKPRTTLLFFVVCCFANIAAALLIHFIGPSASVAIALKDIALFSIIALSLVAFRVNHKDIIYISLIAAYAAVFLIISANNETPPIAALSGLRQIITVFLIISLGALLSSKTKTTQENTIKHILAVGVIIASIGVIERFTHLWSPFIREYFELKNIGVLSIGYPFVLIEPLPVFNEFNGVTGFLRASSTFLDPVNFGHAMVFWFFLSSIMGLKRLKYLFLLSVIISFSKAAIFQLILIALYRSRISFALKISLCLAATVIGLTFIATHAGFDSHFRGLVNSIGSLSVFGKGLGEAGNVSAMYATNDSGIGDSFIGALIGQVGIAGTLIWSILLAYQLKQALTINSTIPLILITQVALGFLSENSFNFLSIMPAAFFCGYIARSKTPIQALNMPSN